MSIEIGDHVTVNFNSAQYTLGAGLKVLYVPQATGDSWQFQDEVSGVIHYVSEGCTITKTPSHHETGVKK